MVFLLSITFETIFLGDRDFLASNCESLTNFTVELCVVVGTPSFPTDFFFFFVGVTLGLITGVDTSLLVNFFTGVVILTINLGPFFGVFFWLPFHA